MDNVNVLIIEDNQAESDPLVKILRASNYNVVAVANNYSEALSSFYKNKVDVIIIDVFLDGKPEGINFAETINAVPDAARPFVFLTSSKDRQIFERAKLTHPFSFLLKPFNELEILYAIEMAVEKFYSQNHVYSSGEQDTVISKDYLFIKKKDSLKKVMISEIIYIEVEERYCNIITENEKFVILISLTKILELLDLNKFFRTHRNYLVNLEKILEVKVSENLIILKGNHTVSLSDKYKDFIQNFTILK